MTFNGICYCFVFRQFYNFKLIASQIYSEIYIQNFDRVIIRKKSSRKSLRHFICHCRELIESGHLTAYSHNDLNLTRTNLNKLLLLFFSSSVIIITCSLTYGNKLCKFLSRNALSLYMVEWVHCDELCTQKKTFLLLLLLFLPTHRMQREFVIEMNFLQ